MVKNKKLPRLALTVLVAILILAGLFFPWNAAQAVELPNGDLSPESGQCVQDYVANANCVANDVRVRYIRIVDLIETCTAGTPGELEADVEIILEAAQPNRYDIGFYIATDGGSALLDETSAGGTNACYHGFLSLSYWGEDPNPIYGDYYLDGIDDLYDLDLLASPDLGFYTTGQVGDTCGDMENQTQAIRTVENLRIPCVDGSGDNIIDVNTCASWRNNEQSDCTSVNEAIPGTTSKCGCEYVNLYGPTNIALTTVSATSAASSGWLVPALAALLFLASAGVIFLVRRLSLRQNQPA